MPTQRELLLIQVMRDIAGCAATTALDANLRIAWIDYQAQETLAALDGATWAQLNGVQL